MPKTEDGPTNEASERKSLWGSKIIRLLLIVGLAFGWFLLNGVLGPIGWMPILFVIVAFLIFTRTKLNPSLRPPLAVISAQTALFVVGIVFGAATTEVVLEFVVEIVVVIVLLAWIIYAQSRASLIALLVYETLGLAAAFYSAATMKFQFAIVVHLLLRIAALVALVVAWIRMRRELVGRFEVSTPLV